MRRPRASAQAEARGEVLPGSLAEAFARVAATADGLEAAEAARRLASVGPNTIGDGDGGHPLALLGAQLGSPLVLILIGAALLTLAVGETTEGLIILGIVLASSALGFGQEYRAAHAMAALRARLMITADVMRDGVAQSVPAATVVPGDIVTLAAGSLIVADGVLLEAVELHVDEAALTGESFPVLKAAGQAQLDEAAFVHMGTSVRSGTATMLVLATGRRTQFGAVASAVGRLQPETDFEKGVRRYGLMMTQLTLVIVLLIFPIGMLLGRPILESLLFSAALAVGMTPELLPAIVSVTLARGAQTLARAGVLVRRLVAIENLGAMNVLCTDKTGTLTEGAVRLELATDAAGERSASVLQLGSLNARLQGGMANPLDDALIAAAPNDAPVTKLGEIPYDFERQRLSVLVERAGAPLLVCKGAVNAVSGRCHSCRSGAEVRELDATAMAQLQARVAAWATDGYRVLAVASRPMPGDAGRLSPADESEMVFEGFLLFSDPLKAGVADVVSGLAGLGVTLKMISGDNRHVARHVAQAAGISGDDMLCGPEMAQLTDRALRRRVHRVDVFAEITPDQKERVVAALRRNGRVVGYLGDGINDAPALRAADLGISVDTALAAAKEAADVVLLRPDLAVLKAGILLGRAAFANTQKYIAITTSANLGNMISMAVASLFLPFLPMLAKQILLNNSLSDLPMLAISTDRVDDAVLQRPGRWDFRGLIKVMLAFGLVSSLFDFLTFGFLLYVAGAGEATFQTGWFVVSLLTELVIILVLRTRRPALASRPSPLLAGLGLGVLLAAVSLPYLPFAAALGLRPLAPGVMAGLIGIVLAYGVASEVLKRQHFRPQRRR